MFTNSYFLPLAFFTDMSYSIYGANITGSKGVIFDRISSEIHHTIVAKINMLLIQITVSDRTFNMQSCYAYGLKSCY